MIELIWLILNVLLFSFIAIKIFRVIKIIREKYGLLISVLCTFFLLSFVDEPKNTKFITEKFNLKNSYNSENEIKNQESSYSEHTIIETKFLTSLIFFVNYNKNEINKENIILNNCFIITDGTICGTDFKMLNITKNRMEKNLYKFDITGEVKWSLMGINLYTQMKKYEVKIKLE